MYFIANSSYINFVFYNKKFRKRQEPEQMLPLFIVQNEKMLIIKRSDYLYYFKKYILN